MSHQTPSGASPAPGAAGSTVGHAVPTYPEPMDAISMDAIPASPAPSRVKNNPEGMPSKVVAGVSLAVLALTFMLNAMDRQVFPPLLGTISKEYGFNLQAGGLLATIFTLGMAIAGIPAGFLVERFSRKTVLIFSIVIYSLGTLATPLASSWGDMALYRIISGLGEGMQAAALFAAVGAFFHNRRGLALGVLGFAFGLGATFGPPLGVMFTANFGSWRAPFTIFGLLGLVIAVVAMFVVSPKFTERAISMTGIEGSYDYMPAKAYNRNSLAIAAASGCGALALYGFLGLYPTFLTTQLHVSTGEAALALSFVGIGGVAGLFGGWIGDRINQRTLLIVSLVVMAVVGVLIYVVQASFVWQCVFACMMGVFGTGVFFPNTNSAIQRAVRPYQVGRAAGLFVTCYYGSAAFSGLLFAALVPALGWQGAGLLQVTLLPLLAAAIMLIVRPTLFNNAVPAAAH
ncbi:MFS transporter [Arthrobacter sp. ISL-48]|uniref:MFS transporter n=1 Tax=Arthrobacter sp. ISL-48 TaxID=2819110 RepID=UPI001BE658E9|nr:MFS transporter [Arthrobacter sp. ISL-48]MBT2532999.1 MFS transporter [Arthrobacter sp. ISL-48]